MKVHSTNYYNGFVEVAEDSPATAGTIPPLRGSKKSVAKLQYDMVAAHPYHYTSDEVFFAVYATRKDLAESELEAAKAAFFSKGQPCFRASPLAKRYGWGVHSDAEGRVALGAVESEQYQQMLADDSLIKVKAMRSKRI